MTADFAVLPCIRHRKNLLATQNFYRKVVRGPGVSLSISRLLARLTDFILTNFAGAE